MAELDAARWRLAEVGEVPEGWATGARDEEGTFDISEVYAEESKARSRAKEVNGMYPRAGYFTLPVVRGTDG